MLPREAISIVETNAGADLEKSCSPGRSLPAGADPMESGPQGASPLLRQDVPTPPRRNLAICRLNNQFLPDSQISLAPSRIFKLPASDRVRPQCVAMSSPQAQTPPAIGHLPAVPAASTSHGAPPGGHAPVPKIPVIKRALKILSRRLVLAGQCGAPDHLRCEHCLPNHVGGHGGAAASYVGKRPGSLITGVRTICVCLSQSLELCLQICRERFRPPFSFD